MIIEHFWQLMLLMGIPSAITALGVWWIQATIVRKVEDTRIRTECVSRYQTILLRSVNATMGLSKETARAIRDGNANGEITKALEYTEKIETDQKKFMEEFSVKKLLE